MDLEQLRQLLEPVIGVFSALIVGGVSVSVATQLLKLNWFPVAVSKYPRITNGVLSVVASLVTIYLSGVQFVLHSVFDYVAFAVGTALLAAFTYKAVLKGTVPTKDGINAKL